LLVGTCIIGSLAGTSYWGPVAGHGLLSHDLEMIRDARKQVEINKQGKISSGEVEAIGAPEDADHYVIIRKKPTNETRNDDSSDSE
jgi:hypothetical protein